VPDATTPLASLSPGSHAERSGRRRLGLRGEFALALMPTLVVLAVMAFVELLTSQRLLFASLASSAFLIYLDPGHGANRVRSIVLAQLMAALFGYAANALIGAEYPAAGAAMVGTIAAMILLDAVHPPAVSTSLAFAFRGGQERDLALFGLALAMTVVLVALQRQAVWLLARLDRREDANERSRP